MSTVTFYRKLFCQQLSDHKRARESSLLWMWGI